MSVIDKFPINQKVEHIRKFDNIQKYEKSHQVVNDQKLNNVQKSMNSQQVPNKTFKSKVTFTPQKPNFPNPLITKPTKVSCSNEKYLNESTTRILSSQDSDIPIQRWKPINKLTRIEKPEVQSNENPKLSKNYISISLDNDVNLIDSITAKI